GDASRSCFARAEWLPRLDAWYGRKMITIEFDHRLEEHLRAARLYHASRSWFSRADKVVAILVAAYGLFLLAGVGVRWWTVIWLVLAPVIWFNLLSIQPLIVRYVFKRLMK